MKIHSNDIPDPDKMTEDSIMSEGEIMVKPNTFMQNMTHKDYRNPEEQYKKLNKLKLVGSETSLISSLPSSSRN
jgi:hypothetical protein